MRYAVLPLIPTSRYVRSESDFLVYEHLIEEADRERRGYFFFALTEKQKPFVQSWNRNNVTFLYNKEVDQFYYQQSFVPHNFVGLFNPLLGEHYIDAVLTSRSGAGALMSKLLWDKRLKEPEIAIIIIEPKVIEWESTHNAICPQDLLLRAAGYAVSCNLFATDRERRLAEKLCKEYLSPAMAHNAMKNSHVIPLGIRCDEIDQYVSKTKKADKFTLFFGGRLTANKQWQKVLADYEKFFSFGRDLDLVVCAPLGSTSLFKAERWGTWGEINLGLPRKQYLEKLVSCHVSMSNSLEEGFTVGICYDDQTEVMTESGWKQFAHLTDEDRVLTAAPDTLMARYVSPKRRIELEFDGYLFSYEEKTVSFAVTPGHKMMVSEVKSRVRRKFRLRPIEEILKKKNALVTAKVVWDGESPKYFVLPSMRREWVASWSKKAKRSYVADARKIPMRPWLRFLGWYVSEGSCQERCVEISQKSFWKMVQIKSNIAVCGFRFKSDFGGGGLSRVRVNSAQLSHWLTENCYYDAARGAKFKKVPDFVFKLSPDLIEEFLGTFWSGDGRKHMGGRDFLTTSRRLADDLQRLILLCGKGASINECPYDNEVPTGGRSKGTMFVVYEKKSEGSLIYGDRVRRIRYKGKVYCVSAPPNGTILVRRRGKAMWCGNCEQIMAGLVVVLPKRDWAVSLLGDAARDYLFFYNGGHEEAYVVLKHVFENYEMCRRQMEPVREYIRKNYDFSTVSQRTFDVIENFVLNLRKRVKRTESREFRTLIDRVLAITPDPVSFFQFMDKIKEYTTGDVSGAERNYRSGFPSRWQVYQFLIQRGYTDTYQFANPTLVGGQSGKNRDQQNS